MSRTGLAGIAPDAIRKHAVRVNDTWFPVIQAFEVATGIPRSEFMSNTALAALGYEVAGDVEPRTAPPTVRRATRSVRDISYEYPRFCATRDATGVGLEVRQVLTHLIVARRTASGADSTRRSTTESPARTDHHLPRQDLPLIRVHRKRLFDITAAFETLSRTLLDHMFETDCKTVF